MHGNSSGNGNRPIRKGSLGGLIDTEHWWKRA
jgi:hypothetical protein